MFRRKSYPDLAAVLAAFVLVPTAFSLMGGDKNLGLLSRLGLGVRAAGGGGVLRQRGGLFVGAQPVRRPVPGHRPQPRPQALLRVQLSGVGDWLLARRLRAMAEAGTVRVDEAGSTRGFYGAAACLA